MHSSPPIRSLASEEGSFEIPWWGIPLILLVIYVSLFSGLGALGLVGPDEPRYAAIARAMAETHDWITPRLWGSPWFEKPVLYYWTAGIAMRVFGVSEFAARLPSAFAALLAVVAVAWTALRSYGIGAAWYSLLLLPTSVAMVGFSRAAGPDMLFAGTLTAAMAVALEMLQKERPGAIARFTFGFFLGAAVLAKGPAAVILAGGATLLWAAVSRRWLEPFRFLHPLIIAAFCITALPWYILCALRNPDFLRIFIWQHNFERYTTPMFEHRQPFWYFLPVFFLGILPWLPILIVTRLQEARKRRAALEPSSPSLFVACWALFTLLFFSASQSKLPGYILPAIPPTILLLAKTLALNFEWNANWRRVSIACVGLMAPLIVGIALAQWRVSGSAGASSDVHMMRAFEITLSVTLVSAALVIGFALRRKLNALVWTTAFTVTLLILLANRMVMPALDAAISARPAGEWLVRAHSLRPEDVAASHLSRSYLYGLEYYLNGTVSEWTSENNEAKVVVCDDKSLTDPQLQRKAGDKFPATTDGKTYVVSLRR